MKKSIAASLFTILTLNFTATFFSPVYARPLNLESLFTTPDHTETNTTIPRLKTNSPSYIDFTTYDEELALYLQRSQVTPVDHAAFDLKSIGVTNQSILEQASKITGSGELQVFFDNLKLNTFTIGHEYAISSELDPNLKKVTSYQNFLSEDNLNPNAPYFQNSPYQRSFSLFDQARNQCSRCTKLVTDSQNQCQSSVGNCESYSQLNTNVTDRDFCQGKIPLECENYDDDQISDFLVTLNETDRQLFFSVAPPKYPSNCGILWIQHPNTQTSSSNPIITKIISIISGPKAGFIEFACYTSAAKDGVEKTSYAFRPQYLNEQAEQDIEDKLTNQPLPPQDDIIDGPCVSKELITQADPPKWMIPLFNKWNLSQQCATPQTYSKPPAQTTGGHASAQSEGSIFLSTGFEIPNPKELAAALNETLFTMEAVFIAPSDTLYIESLGGHPHYGLNNLLTPHAEVMTNSPAGYTSIDQELPVTGQAESQTICREKIIDVGNGEIRTIQDCGLVAFSNDPARTVFHSLGGSLVYFLEQTFGQLRAHNDPERYTCEPGEFWKFTNTLTNGKLARVFGKPDPGRCGGFSAQEGESTRPEISCQEQSPAALGAPATPEGNITLDYTIDFKNPSDEICMSNQEIIDWVKDPSRFPSSIITPEKIKMIEARAKSAGLSPAFTLAIWIEESGASDYCILPDYETYDFGAVRGPAYDFETQLSIFTKTLKTYQISNTFSCREDPTVSFEDFMLFFSEGGCQTKAVQERYFSANRHFPGRVKYVYEKIKEGC